jgi:hypothetical protein
LPVPAAQRKQDSILKLRVGPFSLRDATMEEALRELRNKNKERILIGFAEVAHSEGAEKKRFTLDVADATVERILDELVRADPRYTYSTDRSVINVVPRASGAYPADLLRIRIRAFAFHGKDLPHNLIAHIGGSAPELHLALKKKELEYAARHNNPVGGTVGSILTGGSEPEIDLELHNQTVREVLNSILIYSQTNLKWSIGWKYEFIIDPNAPTGLGGYPKWDAF